MQLNFKINLRDKSEEIGQKLLRAVKQHIFIVLNAAKPPIYRKTKEIVKQRLAQSPEWQSLLSQAQNKVTDLKHIEEALVESVRLDEKTIRITRGSLSGGFTLYIAHHLFTDFLKDTFNYSDDVVDYLNILVLSKQDHIISSYDFGFAETFRKGVHDKADLAEDVVEDVLNQVFAGVEDEISKVVVQEINQRVKN